MISKYEDALVPGRYQLLDNFRSVFLMDPMIQQKAEMYFPKGVPSKIRCYMAEVLNKISFFNTGKHSSKGEYEALYIANNYDKIREVKLFSFSKKRVLAICTSYADMTKQLQEYACFGNVYMMPRVAENIEFENALDVSMIDRLEFPGDEQALTTIAVTTANYNQNARALLREPVKGLISFFYEDETINTCLTNLSKDVHKDILDLELPLCIQHGDLSKDNLIFGESEGETAFWWIDWEHVRERVFFYDYFFYVFNSALYEDTGAFNCYISGRNDTTLKAFFLHMGLIFDPNKKWDYFLVFCIVFLKERVCNLGNVSVLIRYCELIEKLKATSDGINI